jgi:hypothetical protein
MKIDAIDASSLPQAALDYGLPREFPIGMNFALKDCLFTVKSVNPKKRTISLELLAIRKTKNGTVSQSNPAPLDGVGTNPNAQAGEPTVVNSP